MKTINMRFIMSRVNESPIMSNLKLSSAAAYVKDFSGINSIKPIVGTAYTYAKVVQHTAEMPVFIGDVETVWLCNSDIWNVLSENNQLKGSLKTSKIQNSDKSEYGNYIVKGNIIHTDFKEGWIEIYHTILQVDDHGYPTLPYDGSLMSAVISYIKYRYFTILAENDIIPYNKVQIVEQEYLWYIGQYSMKNIIPSYDDAVAWANTWQRLLDDRNQDLDSKSYRQRLNF